MKIASTARQSDDLNRMAKVAAQALPAPGPDDTTMATLVTQKGLDGRTRAIFGEIASSREEQTFSQFLKTPGMVAVKEVWSLLKPSLPDRYQLAGKLVFLTLDGAGLYDDWSRVTPFTSGEDLASISLTTAKFGIEALAALNGAAGRSTDTLNNIKFAIADTQTILRGSDPYWLQVHGDFTKSSLFYGLIDSSLKVTEAALADHPTWGGVSLNGIRDLASGDPKLADRLSRTDLTPPPYGTGEKT